MIENLMKESDMITTEEKAKAYDEALERAKTLYENANGMILKKWVEQVFPELAESEDEKVREELIKHLKEGAEGYEPAGDSSDYQRWLAWLRKQGEPKPEENKGNIGGISANWSVEDMSKAQRICKYLNEAKKYYADITEVRECIEWLKSLQDRVQPQPKQWWRAEEEAVLDALIRRLKGEDIYVSPHLAVECLESLKGRVLPKQEWSEDDEQHIDSLLKRLDALCRNKFERTRFAISEDRDWLKSLRPQNRWKPSDEQVSLLQAIINEPNNAASESCQIVLKDILEQLKKLKEE